MEDKWVTVGRKKDRVVTEKIQQPCWFYNHGGCKHKDGTEKTADECKYLHILHKDIQRPPHLSTRKPCDKYNLEGECKWYDDCKYSHRNLSPEEWSIYYPDIPYTLKTNIAKRIRMENTISELEQRIIILEYKNCGMSKDLQNLRQELSARG